MGCQTTGSRAKEFGAYYTDRSIADVMARWAIRSPQDRVLDPSFGGGVFLQASAQRLRQLGGQPGQQLHGVELDAAAYSRTCETMARDFSVSANQFRTPTTSASSLLNTLR